MSNKDARVKDDGFIYMVLEYGEIDLAHMLSQKWKEIEGSDRTIDENWLRFYWQVLTQLINFVSFFILQEARTNYCIKLKKIAANTSSCEHHTRGTHCPL